MGPSLDQPQHPKLCCGLLGLLWAQICALAASLPGSIQDYASPGPAIGSISFDFVTKLDGTALVRRGIVKPHWSNCSDAFLAIRTGLAS